MSFVHLHCHSAYSLLESTSMPQALVSAAKKLKMPALALTDRNNLYGAVHFYQQAHKAGIKPVIGMEVDLDDGSRLVLLARSLDGYRNLCHLATVLRLKSDPEALPPAGFYPEDEDEEILPWETGVWGVPVFGFTGKPGPGKSGGSAQAFARKEPCLPRDMLLSGRHVRGLIALSGGRHGLVNSLVMNGKTEQGARAAGMLLSAFGEGNFFIELQAASEKDRKSIPPLIALANDLTIPVVAANDVLYTTPQEAPAALALAASRRGLRGVMLDGSGHAGNADMQGFRDNHAALHDDIGSDRYLKSAEEMAELFRDYPQAIANTSFIADRCDLELPLGKPLFPKIEIPPDETPFSRLWKLCFAGATRRYRPLTELVLSRLKHEMEIIETLGFSDYFLVVHDIVHFAHSRDIPILARGSAANSLVAYALGITQVDPLANDLLFERFLNTSRATFELPDIDLDLCWRRRDEVLHYVYERYGHDHVAIVGTHITFRSRSAWREMAKVFGVPPDRINYVGRRLPQIKGVEDERALDGLADPDEPEDGTDDYQPEEVSDSPAPRLRDEREQSAFNMSKDILGLPRHAGMHCGGMVITPGPIADLIPLQRAARDPSMAITQYDKDQIESMGLVKMDLLGSRALTTLVDTVKASGMAQGKNKTGSVGNMEQALASIPYDDERTYRMMADGNTLGCFQLESPGMRGLLKWLRPRKLSEIAIAVSLFRPGPLEGGFLETFMRRHLKQELVSYHHPSMEPILKETNGVILYQEQFLKLAHTLAGLSLGEAEKLRKDLGKARTPDERTRLGIWFTAGAIERGIDQVQAEKVWEIIAGYTGFGFCKAHACSYALAAYRSAYMKAHYPAQFIAAVINNQGGYYGPAVYVEDARSLHIEMLPPDINLSSIWCEVPPRSRSIRMGLQFVKGLSEKTMAAIISERHSRGRFRSLFDLMARVSMSPGEVAALVKVGACDIGHDEPSIASIAGMSHEIGETEKTLYMPAMPPLNRKQMMLILPGLLSIRKSSARGALRREHGSLDMGIWLKATGSDSGPHPSIQMVMGDFAHIGDHHDGGVIDGTRILGASATRIDIPDVGDYTPAEKLELEHEAMGFAVSRNMMELYSENDRVPKGNPALPRDVVYGVELHKYAERDVSVAGIVVSGRRHMTKSGEWMLFLTLQDAKSLIEVVLFPETCKASEEVLAGGGYGPYLIHGQVQVSGKGRGVGVQLPAGMLNADAVTVKMHPVIIADKVALLD